MEKESKRAHFSRPISIPNNKLSNYSFIFIHASFVDQQLELFFSTFFISWEIGLNLFSVHHAQFTFFPSLWLETNGFGFPRLPSASFPFVCETETSLKIMEAYKLETWVYGRMRLRTENFLMKKKSFARCWKWFVMFVCSLCLNFNALLP